MEHICQSKILYLSREIGSSTWWIVLRISGHIASTQFLDGHVLDVESNVVAWHGLCKSLVVHLNGLYLSDQVDRCKVDDHACKEFKSNMWQQVLLLHWLVTHLASECRSRHDPLVQCQCHRSCRHPAEAGATVCQWAAGAA